MKFKTSLIQRKDEIKGKVDISSDPVFNMEALLLIVESVAATHEVTVKDVLTDVWRIYERQTNHQRQGYALGSDGHSA